MKNTILFFGLIFFLISCEQEEPHSIIPFVKFVAIEKLANDLGYDYKANLKFYFEDGDGDVGLDDTSEDMKPPFDTSSFYHYNFFINYYEKQNGTFVKVDLPVEQNARIPRLSNHTPESIDGEINIEIFINNFTSSYDTVRFEFYIVDRALHHSNIVTTPEIIINK